MEYTSIELLLGGSILFVAYLVRGITGFGSGLIAIPLLSLLFPITVVVPVVVLLDLLGSGSQALSGRKEINWHVLLPLIPATLVGIALAMYFFKYVDTSTLTHWLGVFVLCLAIYQLLPTPEISGGKLLALPLGTLGGLVGTLFGTGGPFYALYLNSRQIGKTEFRSSYAVYFVLDGLVRMGAYIFGLSLMNSEWVNLLLLAFIPFYLGLMVGGKVHKDLDPILFKKFISLILLASGSALILNS